VGALIDVILPVFLVIGLVYLAVRLGLFTDSAVDGLMKFATGFAIPALLAVGIATLDLGESFRPGMLLAFYGGALTSFVVGMLGARFLFGRAWEDSVVVGFVGLFSNTVLLGLPVTERAYGPDEVAHTLAIVSIHAPFCYLVGITVMETMRSAGKGVLATVGGVVRAMARNPIMIGIALGFALNLSGLPIPALARDALDMLIRAALPAALFALGGVLCRYRPEGDLRLIAYACTVSLVVHPATVWVLGTLLDISRPAFRSAVVTSAMAPGINAFLFADLYGRARRVAASTVLVATAASFVTALVWLSLLG
jgi:predicted permease